MLGRPILKAGPGGSASVSAEHITGKLCAYMSQPCDCKFGVVVTNGPRAHEHGSGCPELSEIAIVLAGMTEKQYAAAYGRGLRAVVEMRKGRR